MTIVDDGLDILGIQVPPRTFVADPNFADAVETEYAKVTLAHPTHDPNRTTIHVPTDKTVLSVGAASPSWTTDLGITGYTAAHVHFETKEHDKTVVSLGGPATTADLEGHGDEPPKKTEGYSMVTEERAWHDAVGQHYLISQEGDISLRTMGGHKRAVVQADAGFVDLCGGKEVNVSGGGVAVGAAAKISFEDVLYDGHFEGKAPASASAKTAKTGMDLVGAVFSAHDLGLKAVKLVKKFDPKNIKGQTHLLVDAPKWALDAVKFGISVNKIRKVFAGAGSPPGCVKIGAEKDVGGLAGHDVSFTGAVGASLASTTFTTLSAGLMATLKGTLWAGVGGILSSVRAQKKLEVMSTWGDAVMSAKKNVELTANDELVAAAANRASVSGTKQVLLGGKHRAFIGAEPGWGALFDDKGVSFGKASGVAALKTATIEDAPAVRIDDDKIEIRGTAGAVTFSNDLCLLEAPGIRFDAKQKNVTFNGQKAILD